MKILLKYLFFLNILLLAGCESIVMNPRPETGNVALFNEYAKICIEKFALQEAKNINLIELADSIRPMITNDVTQEQLFDYMSILTLRMQEGHTTLTAPELGLQTTYPYFEDFPFANGTAGILFYYSPEVNPTARQFENNFFLTYGLLPGHENLGFIRITGFDFDITKEQIEVMMAYLADTDGLIIDVRTNFGGLVFEAASIASYFTEESVEFGTNLVKNGPGPNDFAASSMVLEPSGSPLTYTKPVMVLQDRISFSSASLFCAMLDPLEHVQTVGQIYGGGTGEIIYGYLSNGWEWVLSTSNLLNHEGIPTDNGIPVDIPQLYDETDSLSDAVIERAINELLGI
jgi:hypothetical protein